MKRAFLLAAGALLSGCVTPWDRYDASLYDVSMEPGPESYRMHADLLQEWIAGDEGCPPGLSAELGFYLALSGRADEARPWFDREVEEHPEAARFVTAMRAVVLPPETPAGDAGDRAQEPARP